MDHVAQTTTDELTRADEAFTGNRLLSTFSREARALIEPYGEMVELEPGEIVRQRAAGQTAVIGAMLESNLVAGNQKFPQPLDQLVRGQSITDACIDWATSVEVLDALAAAVRARRKAAGAPARMARATA